MTRRWIILLLIDLVLIGTVLLGAKPREWADFVFVCGSAHKYLDPQRMSWMHDVRLAECLFEPLVRIKLPEMTVEPAVAERWEVSTDGLTYTFHLRPEARWSNGESVKASDFAYTWRRALLPDLAADYTQLFWDIEGAEAFFKRREAQLTAYVQDAGNQSTARAQQLLEETYRDFDNSVGIHAVDDRTLIVKLARPVPYFLQLAAFITYAPVHLPTVDAHVSLDVNTGRLIQDPYWSRPDRIVCNGPYILKRYRYKRDVLLEANPHYWNRAAMGNQSILELIVDNPASAMLLYESGEADWLPDIPATGPLAADLVARKRSDVHVISVAGTYFYNFNCQPKLPDGSPNPLANPRVRQALSMGIDRESLIQTVTRLGQRPARTFTPLESVPGYEPPVDAGVTFNPEEARRLLAEAGYSDKPLTGLVILYNTGAGHERIAEQISRAWKDYLGVEVALKGIDTTAFAERLRKHDFIITRASWFGDYMDPTTFLDKFKSENGNNDAGYRNPRFDALMADAANELDPARRMALLREAEVLMLSEQPIAPIYQYVNMHIFNPDRVKNLYPNPWSFRRLELVKVLK